MVQAVILSSFAVTCATLFLLLVPRPWRAHGSAGRRDGLGGVREVRAAPLPDLPPTGAELTTPTAVAVAAPPAEPVAAAAARSDEATPALMPQATPAVQSGARNDGFARFARSNRGRHAAPDRAAEPVRPAEVRATPTR